jgi:excisionase family DNA binding protein
MTSETKIAYGSRVLRQGRSRPFVRNQAKSSESIGERLLAAAAPEAGERLALRTPCEHLGLAVAEAKREFLTASRGSGQLRSVMPETFQLLRKAEAARLLDVSPSTLDRLRARGEIAWVGVGGSVRFSRAALEDYVKRAERPVRPPQEPEPRARSLPAPPPPGPRRERAGAGQTVEELFPLSELLPSRRSGGVQ